MKSKELREKRAKLVADAQALLKKGPEMSAEDRDNFDKMMDEVDRLKADIDRIERLEDEQRNLEIPPTPPPAQGLTGDEETREQARVQAEGRAFTNWVRYGLDGLSTEDRKIIQNRRAPVDPETRQQTVTTTGGGYLIPPGFSGRLEEALKSWGGMRRVATILRTGSGSPMTYPTVDDTGVAGELLAINTQAAGGDVTFGVVSFDAYKFSSKVVLVPIELLQDSAFDIDSLLVRLFARRIGSVQNTYFTTGTGTGQPNGIVTAATLGKTGASGQTTSIIYNDLVDLEHSVDPDYRPGAKWMMSDTMLKTLKKLVDDQSRPLWLPGVAVREPDTLMGYPYVINQDVAVPAASAKSLLFGALDKYHIREVMDISVLRLVERYADYGQVGFLAFARADGDLVDAGTHPVKYYANAAS